MSAPSSGGVAVGLKPGIINMVPVTKKEFKGADPWVTISGFHVKIDGCVGESFIRSYAVLDPVDRPVRRHPGLLRNDQRRSKRRAHDHGSA